MLGHGQQLMQTDPYESGWDPLCQDEMCPGQASSRQACEAREAMFLVLSDDHSTGSLVLTQAPYLHWP